MKTLHLSDWHTDAPTALKRLEAVPDLNYGLIAVTGDMWEDRDARWQLEQWQILAKQLKIQYPKRPIVAVPGNHDVYAGKVAGVSMVLNGAKTFKAAGFTVTGLHVPQVTGRNDNVLPEVGWIQQQIGELNKNAHLLICHYPPEYLPGMSYWLEQSNVKAYLCGHYHSDFGVSTDNTGFGRLYSNASTGYSVLDVY